MIDILTPQRFYQITNEQIKERYGNGKATIHKTLDLKVITEITLVKDEQGEQIGIFKQFSEPTWIIIDENKVGQEEYVKIVKAWTTYKLATEK